VTFLSEYHNVVKSPVPRPIPAPHALFGMFLLPLLLLSISPAQNNSAAPGHAAGTTPSVTASSSNPHSSANAGVSSTKTPPPATGSRGNNTHPQRPANIGQVFYYYPYLYAVPVPYPLDISDNGPSEDDPNYQGGPTVFDRRGSGPASYIPPVSDAPDQEQAANSTEDAPTTNSNSEPTPPPDPTVLIFKDGRQLEVQNYAIVNQTLYDLTPGRPRKIALADLDLPATQKQNDDRGVAFGLPSSSQAN